MKSERIDIRVSPETKEKWCSLAEEKGLSLTEFIVVCVEGVHTDTVHTREDKGVGVHTKKKEFSKDNAAKEAIAKCKKIEKDYKTRNKVEQEFRSYFKDKKLNER